MDSENQAYTSGPVPPGVQARMDQIAASFNEMAVVLVEELCEHYDMAHGGDPFKCSSYCGTEELFEAICSLCTHDLRRLTLTLLRKVAIPTHRKVWVEAEAKTLKLEKQDDS